MVAEQDQGTKWEAAEEELQNFADQTVPDKIDDLEQSEQHPETWSLGIHAGPSHQTLSPQKYLQDAMAPPAGSSVWRRWRVVWSYQGRGQA